ncbi:MAG: Transcriptional regulator, TetR family [Mycobacterium sp.]|nr:Transcriptional regulator, TetR family [Mycobacterium sp.]
MAPPRKHSTDTILDATRTLVLAAGPRAAGVAAIAEASGAPAGTLYHRFGNRDGILSAVWLRALDRFQARVLDAAGPTALDSATAMAVAAVRFARDLPDDARLLLTVRPADLLDSDAGFATALASRNAPLGQRLRELSCDLFGADDPRSLDAVHRAVVDLPYAVIRRHGADVPAWLDADVAAGVRALLLTHGAAVRAET